MNILSFVIPAYNESKTIELLVNKVHNLKLPKGFEKELIIINDCSTDNTFEIVRKIALQNRCIRVFSNEQNLGKSRSVRKGILKTRGSKVIIQDADLEYNPSEIITMLKLMESRNLDVVFGNRFGKKNKIIYLHNYIGNRFVSFVSNLFTYPRIRTWLPDIEVCYKLMDGTTARAMAQKLVSKSMFGLEPEITARLSKFKRHGKHLKFGVVPITYHARSISEGKKMRAFRDGVKALGEIIYFNLFVK